MCMCIVGLLYTLQLRRSLIFTRVSKTTQASRENKSPCSDERFVLHVGRERADDVRLGSVREEVSCLELECDPLLHSRSMGVCRATGYRELVKAARPGSTDVVAGSEARLRQVSQGVDNEPFSPIELLH